MDAELLEMANRFATKRELILVPSLGGGIHGIVFEAKDHRKPAPWAIKILSEREPFERECAAYRRLVAHRKTEIFGFHVPQLLGTDEEFLVIEMTIVKRPFLVDFASAFLDRLPDLPIGAIEYIEEKIREEFGERSQTVQEILAALRGIGIYQLDPSPGNIGFRD